MEFWDVLNYKGLICTTLDLLAMCQAITFVAKCNLPLRITSMWNVSTELNITLYVCLFDDVIVYITREPSGRISYSPDVYPLPSTCLLCSNLINGSSSFDSSNQYMFVGFNSKQQRMIPTFPV